MINSSIAKFSNIFPIVCFSIFINEYCFIVEYTKIEKALFCLKNHIQSQFSLLTCISAVDFFNFKYRFCIVYELLSLSFNIRLRLKVFSLDFTPNFSITSIFLSANWWEREIWDMFGIFFYNHKDLRRLLTDYGFDSFPLRKDFPLSGFFETRYSLLDRRVSLYLLEYFQEHRFYINDFYWENSKI